MFVAFTLSEGSVQAFAPARPLCRPTCTQHAALTQLGASEGNDASEIKPDILEPFPPAADPMYPVRGAVGEDHFILTRSGGPTEEELSNENLLRILKIECSDLEVCKKSLEVASMSSLSKESFVLMCTSGQYARVEVSRIPIRCRE
jgi:hypothetical protein